MARALVELEREKPSSVNWRSTSFRVGDQFRFSGLHGQEVEAHVLTITGIRPWGKVHFSSTADTVAGCSINSKYSQGLEIPLTDALAMVEEGILCEITEGPEVRPPWAGITFPARDL